MQAGWYVPSVREAAWRVSRAWNGDNSELSDADLSRELDALVRLIENGPDSQAKALSGPPLGFVRRRLLEQVRTETMEVWRNEPTGITPGDMLHAVLGFDAAARLLDPSADPGARARETPNGLELLVEVAHDFRAALTSIIYLSEALRRGHGGDLSDMQRRQLGIIYRAAVTLMSTANDVIELTTAGEHLLDAEPATFSLTQTLDSVLSVVRPIAEEKGLQLTHNSPRLHIRSGNAAALQRVLLNLATNALKFTETGGVEIGVNEDGDDRVEFSVRDTGPGISENILSNLFQPFRRTTMRDSGYSFSGSGLGLATCRKLVRAMGSELHVEVTPGRGTRFYFELELPPVPR